MSARKIIISHPSIFAMTRSIDLNTFIKCFQENEPAVEEKNVNGAFSEFDIHDPEDPPDIFRRSAFEPLGHEVH